MSESVSQNPVPLSGPGTGGSSLVQIQFLLLYHRFSHSAGNDRAAYHILPAGAFYALFNGVSLFRMKMGRNNCFSCGKCAKARKMDADAAKTPNLEHSIAGIA